MKRAPNSISSLAIAGFVAFAFGVAPVGLDYDFTPEIKSAFAKGKGSGNSGGKGGSKSSSSGGKGGAADLDTASGDEDVDDKTGNGHLKAQGNGHANNHDGEGDPNEHGKLASSLGNLNAAHASPTGLANASENSVVGMLRLYLEEVDPEDPDIVGLTPEEQRIALGEISNKTDGEPVDDAVVAEVNRLLGLPEEEPVVTP
jgi:hypothetical protein